MIIKIMDAGDIRIWRSICKNVEEAYGLAEMAPMILEDGERFDESVLDPIKSLQRSLTAVEDGGLYPAYIPTNAL